MEFRRPSLSIGRAGALAALLAFGVTAGAGFALDHATRGEFVRDAQSRAEMLVAPALRDHLSSVRLAHGGSRFNPRSLRAALGSARRKETTVRIWDRTGSLRYADRSVSALAPPSRRDLAAALSGQSSSTTVEAQPGPGQHSRTLLRFYLPLRPRGEERPAGLLEIHQPSSVVVSAMERERTQVLVTLLVGFVLLTAGFGWLLVGATERLKRRAERVERDAACDPLTGLPNRVMFGGLIEEALARHSHGSHLGVLLLDLDRFKAINDALGHFNGDLILKRLAARLSELLREGDVVARLGGDEFAILLPRLQTRDSARHIAERISAALHEPFTASGLALEVEGSIGIAIFPGDGEHAEDLLRAADVAMYAAKRDYANYKFHSPEQHRYRPEQLGLAAELRRAIDRGELVLHYQPKVCLQTNQVHGVEALVRWQHRQQGLLFPDAFIPITEHTSLIRPLTLHVIETALAQVLAWREEGIDLSVAVNVSTQILLDNDFPRDVSKLLFDLHAPPRLEVEVTESSIMQDPRRAASFLGRLRDLRIRVAIDDFGTGYSSLSALKQLPVDSLKIDKSFVMGMEENLDDQAIVRATARLGQDLGLNVVAEGVESQAAARQLATFGCNQGQGYHFSKPVEAERLRRWLLAYREMFAPDRSESAAAIAR